jgi:hypothetical protein
MSKKTPAPKPARKRTALVNRSEIVRDRSLQIRVGGTSRDQVEAIREAVRGKKKLPKIELWEVAGRGLLLVDGWHRDEAAGLEGKTEIDAVIHTGTIQQAMLAAATANRTNLGLPLKTADKRAAVIALLRNFPRWSATTIADAVGSVSRQTVATVKKELAAQGEIEEADTVVGKDGKERPKQTQPTKAAAGVQADGWESLPLTEWLKADDRVWLALANAKVETAGELAEAIRSGALTGELRRNDIADLHEEVETLKRRGDVKFTGPVPVPEANGKPKSGTTTSFSYPAFEGALRSMVREHDNLLRSKPGEHEKADTMGVGRLLGELAEAAKKLNKRLLQEAR